MRADLSFPKKLHAFFHLANSIIFICIVVVSVLSIPLLILKSNSPALDRYFLFASFTVLSFLSSRCVLFYFTHFQIRKSASFILFLFCKVSIILIYVHGNIIAQCRGSGSRVKRKEISIHSHSKI